MQKITNNLTFIIWLAAIPMLARAEACPDIADGLKFASDSIAAFQNNDRSPAGADCAYGLAMNHRFDLDSVSNNALLFYKSSADVQRMAYKKRNSERDQEDADRYLEQEIEIRRKFLSAALKSKSKHSAVSDTRRMIVEHISYLASAMALRSEYEQLTQELGDRNADVIDDAALKVWLSAVWSCAKWDGKKANVCSADNRELCRGKIEVFLSAVDEMKGRNLGRETKRDIANLRRLQSQNTCFGAQTE